MSNQNVSNILGSVHLTDAPNILVEARNKPICNVPKMIFGSMANDNGNLIIDEDEYHMVEKNSPELLPYIRLFLGSEEYINNINRYCLWLKNAPPDVLLHSYIKNRLEKVREKRLESSREATRKLSEYPYLFGEDRQPDTNYLMVPATSSENRKYIPIGFLGKEVIASNACLIIPNATLYHFGVLTSFVHMAWMRTVAGRLKSDYRYSAKVVYNNFPWPNPTPEQKEKIEKTAQGILDARELYHNSSLDVLYNDQISMPKELRKAIQENNRAVMEAYEFDWKNITEEELVVELLKLYQELTEKQK